MWTEGQKDITKLIVAFRNFAKAPKSIRTSEIWLKFHMLWYVVIFFVCRETNEQKACTVMHIRCAFVGFVNGQFMQIVSKHSFFAECKTA